MSCSGPFTDLHVHTAKCSECDERNRNIMKKCEECGEQLCRSCFARCGGLHGPPDYLPPANVNSTRPSRPGSARPRPQPASARPSVTSARSAGESTVRPSFSSAMQNPSSSPPGATRRSAVVLEDSESPPDHAHRRATATATTTSTSQPDAPADSLPPRRQSSRSPARSPTRSSSAISANSSTGPPRSTASTAQVIDFHSPPVAKPRRRGEAPAAQAKEDLAAMSTPPIYQRTSPMGLTLAGNNVRPRPSRAPTLGESLTLQSSSPSKPRIYKSPRVNEMSALHAPAQRQPRAPVIVISDSDESDAESPIRTRLTLVRDRTPAITPASAAGSNFTPIPQTEPVPSAVIQHLQVVPTEWGNRVDVDEVAMAVEKEDSAVDSEIAGDGEQMDVIKEEVEDFGDEQVVISNAEEQEGASPTGSPALGTLVGPTNDMPEMAHGEESGDEDFDVAREVYQPRATRSGRLSTLRSRAADATPTSTKRSAPSRIPRSLNQTILDDDEDDDDVGPQTCAFNAYLNTIKLPKEFYAYKEPEPRPIIDTYGLREPSKPVLRDDVLPISQSDLPRELRWNDPWNNGGTYNKRKTKKKSNKTALRVSDEISGDEYEFRSRATPPRSPSPYAESRVTYESFGAEPEILMSPSMLTRRKHNSSSSALPSSRPLVRASMHRLSMPTYHTQPHALSTSYIRSSPPQYGTNHRADSFHSSRQDNVASNNTNRLPTRFQEVLEVSDNNTQEPERMSEEHITETQSTIPSRRPLSPDTSDRTPPKRRRLDWRNDEQRDTKSPTITDPPQQPAHPHAARAARSSYTNHTSCRCYYQSRTYYHNSRLRSTRLSMPALGGDDDRHRPATPTLPSPSNEPSASPPPMTQTDPPATPTAVPTSSASLPPLASFLHTQGSSPNKLLRTPSRFTTSDDARLPPMTSFRNEQGSPAEEILSGVPRHVFSLREVEEEEVVGEEEVGMRDEREVSDGERWAADKGYRDGEGEGGSGEVEA